MQARHVPVAAGRQWVLQGFGLLKKAPAAFGALVFLYLVVLLFSSVVPLLGAFAPLLLTPILTIGLTDAARRIDQGQAGSTINPAHLFIAFKQPKALRSLFLLGLINAAATVLAIGLAALVDGGALFEMSTGQTRPDDARLDPGTMLTSLLVFALVYTPLQMLLWYAPLLVAWHGVPPSKALFFSGYAVWLNKGAFFNYGLTWLVLVLSASVLLQVVGRLLGGSTAVMSLLLMPLSLLIVGGVMGSFWPSFRDVFQATAANDPEGPTPEQPDQA
jgi:hypothetical protein